MGGRPSPARHFFDTRQKTAVVVAGVATALGFAVNPRWTGISLISIAIAFYGAVLIFKAGLVHAAWLGSRQPGEPDPIPDPSPTLPSYTILVPLFHEGNVVEDLVTHLRRLDYPVLSYEVLLLCEYDDAETIGAIRRLTLPFNFRLVICPAGEPRTKPRACNIGLAVARGKYCVIYDAEDRPDLEQLRRAAEMFAVSDDTTVCLQARLDYHNHHHNWLTRFFTLEYNFWFDLLLPALVRKDWPIPLGGTSNHFHTRKLRRLGGWDPYNVTEDADLGMRLYLAGWRTRMLDSVTQEEACARVRPWTRQRTRWLKGYLQTWAVHSRTRSVWQRGGGSGWLAMTLLLLGTPIVNLINPVFWLANIYFAVTRDPRILELFPRPLLYASVAIFVIGNFMFVYTNFLGLLHRERWHLVSAVLLTPF
jgi:glycosyltransferase XagB